MKIIIMLDDQCLKLRILWINMCDVWWELIQACQKLAHQNDTFYNIRWSCQLMQIALLWRSKINVLPQYRPFAFKWCVHNPFYLIINILPQLSFVDNVNDHCICMSCRKFRHYTNNVVVTNTHWYSKRFIGTDINEEFE